MHFFQLTFLLNMRKLSRLGVTQVFAHKYEQALAIPEQFR